MSTEKKLTPDEVLAAALQALADARSGERMTEAMFGNLASNGGCWWSFGFVRSVGSNPDRHSEDRERERLAIIKAWREQYFPAAHEALPEVLR